MEILPKSCLSFCLLDSSLGCEPRQQAKFPDDSLTHYAADLYSESDAMGFAANAQHIAGGSLEGLQVPKGSFLPVGGKLVFFFF